MTALDGILTDLGDTCLARTARELLLIYKELDEATASFAAACGIACPEGCGRCCEGFDPPVTSVEADLAALSMRGAPLRASGATTVHPCLFFRSDTPFHCGIYPVRPLVCRAFGFSAVGDRHGKSCFHFCGHMPGRPRSQLDERSMVRLFPRLPPRVDEHGIRLSAISHESMGAQFPLSTAIHGSLDKVRALLAYVRAAEGP
jgi:uncharacterized protein